MESESAFVIDKTGESSNVTEQTSKEGSSIRVPKNRRGPKKIKNGYTEQDRIEEEELTKLIFGDSEILNNLGTETKKKSKKRKQVTHSEEKNEASQDKSNVGKSETVEDESSTPVESSAKPVETDETQKPAWEDEDDLEVKVNIGQNGRLKKLRKDENEDLISGKEYAERLKQQFTKFQRQSVDWAEVKEEDESDLILRTTANMIDRSKRRALPQGILQVQRMRDANAAEYSQSVVQSIGFHPNSQLFFTAGFDKKLRLFQIDGKDNNKVQSIHFDDMPIHKAQFNSEGSEILLTGRRKFFFFYDVISGKVTKIPRVIGREERSWEKSYMSPDDQLIALLGHDGAIVLLSGKTKQNIGTLKMNGIVTSASFSKDGKTIFTTGEQGEIYEWDIGSRRCVSRFTDEGALKGSFIQASNDYLASGAESGVVNIYDISKTRSKNPKPQKELLHLTTEVSDIQFNYDQQIMAISSVKMRDSVKLVHLPSYTVFSNWPTSNTPLGYASSVAFSPNGGYITIGNDKGTVLLYRLNHYQMA